MSIQIHHGVMFEGRVLVLGQRDSRYMSEATRALNTNPNPVSNKKFVIRILLDSFC